MIGIFTYGICTSFSAKCVQKEKQKAFSKLCRCKTPQTLFMTRSKTLCHYYLRLGIFYFFLLLLQMTARPNNLNSKLKLFDFCNFLHHHLSAKSWCCQFIVEVIKMKIWLEIFSCKLITYLLYINRYMHYNSRKYFCFLFSKYYS